MDGYGEERGGDRGWIRGESTSYCHIWTTLGGLRRRRVHAIQDITKRCFLEALSTVLKIRLVMADIVWH